MRIIEPSFEIISPIDRDSIYKHLERIGRICYKSEDKITEESAEAFIKMLISRGHEAMIEHYSISVLFIVDRGVSHELVRHRIASFAQESTRYCNYSADKFGKGLTFINPMFFEKGTQEKAVWNESMALVEDAYMDLVDNGTSPQEARSVLPNSLKTEIVVTANMREWRTIMKLRTAPSAHPQMRQVMLPLLHSLKSLLPALFEDIEEVV